MKIFFTLLIIVLSAGLLFAQDASVSQPKDIKILVWQIDDSSYKTKFIAELKDSLPKITIEIIDADTAADYLLKDNEYMLVMDALWAGGRGNHSVATISAGNATRTIVFMTAGDSEAEFSVEGVDTVTAASKKEFTADSLQKIKKLILEKIK